MIGKNLLSLMIIDITKKNNLVFKKLDGMKLNILDNGGE